MMFQDQVVFITGAGRGIGKAVAIAFGRAGANLFLVARSSSDLDRTARELKAVGVTCLAQPTDVSRRSAVEYAVRLAMNRFGRIDVLVNAAGVYGPIGPFVENDLDHWVQATETNLMGTVFCLRAILPHMIARRNGVAVNFSGGGAVSPFPRFSAYATSKAAVVRLTETIAEEVKAHNIRINAIAPGAVNTRLLDQVLAAGERAGAEFHARAKQQAGNGGVPPEKAAELVLFLASPLAVGITGKLISAVWDDWKSLSDQASKLGSSSLFTLRRIDGRNFLEAACRAQTA